MIDWSRFAEIVAQHSRFVLTTHIRPDCDCLGSQLVMAGLLEQLGKSVLLCNPFAVPRHLQFLDPVGRMKQLGKDVPPTALEDYEVLIVLDTSAFAQLGAMADVLRTTGLRKVVIDHHVSEDALGAEMFKDVDAEATGRLVVEAADALGVALTPEMAQAALAAVATDTGWFRFASTSSETFALAARLVAAGANPTALYNQLYEKDTLARLQLIGRTLGRAQVDLGGRLIYSWIELSDFQALGALPSDSEDIINLTLSVDGIEVAMLLVEQQSGGFKVSLRSRNQLDCSRVAEQFGGGGHKQAAGLLLREPLESARAKLLEAIRKAMP